MVTFADATYRVVPLYGGVFGVEVVAGSYPATVSAFDTIAEAEDWIARHRQAIIRAATSQIGNGEIDHRLTEP
jgi:hypothetical protein